MIGVLVAGAAGRMGREVVKAVAGDENLELVGTVDFQHLGQDAGTLAGIGELGVVITQELVQTIKDTQAQVVVDFTNPDAVLGNIKTILNAGAYPVVGTTGLDQKELEELDQLAKAKGLGCLVAPNFAIGAILMMKFAAQAAKYMPHVEIIELHHDQKLDAPSGTALKTAEAIMKVRESFRQGHFNEFEKIPGSRGGDYEGMRIHSVRLPGYVAHQEVIFGGLGQSLIIRHDSISRESFMPGVVLACNKIMDYKGVVYGLENLLAE
ncbi:MAG: 4-hydroxy-tetrahydrodipicolinate reductase [Thermincolia bacterium]